MHKIYCLNYVSVNLTFFYKIGANNDFYRGKLIGNSRNCNSSHVVSATEIWTDQPTTWIIKAYFTATPMKCTKRT